MLTREQRDQWAEELESGKWKQGRGRLHKDGRFCCLGILAIAVLGEKAEHLDSRCFVDLDRLTVDEQVPFARLNDTEKRRFRTIAKHVRSLPVSDEAQP